jgi:hypothetical protein
MSISSRSQGIACRRELIQFSLLYQNIRDWAITLSFDEASRIRYYFSCINRPASSTSPNLSVEVSFLSAKIRVHLRPTAAMSFQHSCSSPPPNLPHRGGGDYGNKKARRILSRQALVFVQVKLYAMLSLRPGALGAKGLSPCKKALLIPGCYAARRTFPART